MQLLHIADLHFGRLLYGRSLMDDQRHFVRQSLLPALDAYKPDALLIAGDLYDRQIASVDAIHLFDELIDALCERSIPAVIISGNHDSPDRIAVGKSLLARHGIHIITELKDAFTPVEIGNIQIFPLPYFENAQMRGKRPHKYNNHAEHKIFVTKWICEYRKNRYFIGRRFVFVFLWTRKGENVKDNKEKSAKTQYHHYRKFASVRCGNSVCE